MAEPAITIVRYCINGHLNIHFILSVSDIVENISSGQYEAIAFMPIIRSIIIHLIFNEFLVIYQTSPPDKAMYAIIIMIMSLFSFENFMPVICSINIASRISVTAPDIFADILRISFLKRNLPRARNMPAQAVIRNMSEICLPVCMEEALRKLPNIMLKSIRTTQRLRRLRKMRYAGSSDSIFLFRENGRDAPSEKRKNGNTRSTHVIPAMSGLNV